MRKPVLEFKFKFKITKFKIQEGIRLVYLFVVLLSTKYDWEFRQRCKNNLQRHTDSRKRAVRLVAIAINFTMKLLMTFLNNIKNNFYFYKFECYRNSFLKFSFIIFVWRLCFYILTLTKRYKVDKESFRINLLYKEK